MMMCGPGVFRNMTPLRLTPSGFQCDVFYDVSDPNTTFTEDQVTLAVNDGDVVGRLLDKSGNGRHATQTTFGACPTLKIVGGVRFLRFKASSSQLLNLSVPKGPSWYAAMAYQKATAGDRAPFLSSLSNSSQSVVQDNNTSRLQTFRGTGTNGGQIYEKTTGGGRTTWSVLGGLCAADGASNIRLNKTDQGALTMQGGAFTPQTSWNVLGRLGGTHCNYDFAGGFLLPRAPSTEEMDILDTWLMGRVGI